ncbi:MAG: shikimate dehydrogenase [Lachnospiraceae bacterium]|nr:shikimate dehydrogenase [Lachnospiraceae bacterium]
MNTPREITGTTRLGGLLGSPVAHSLSPLMHNLSFRELGLDFVYLCFDVKEAQMPSMAAALREMNVYGFNLTMPCKQAIIPCLDELSDAARLIGAVNTVVNDNGRLIGHNTDGMGFMRSVRENGCDIAGREMTLLGSGGAASAIAVQAALDGAKALHLACRRGRSWGAAEELVRRINEGTSCQADLIELADTTALKERLDNSAILVNGTSAGMSPNEELCPLPDTSILSPELLVGDVIYHPRKTRLMAEAEALGCRTFNGMYMLLYQGAAAFELWTGQPMPVEVVRQAYFSSEA